MQAFKLTHWGRVTHICVSEPTSIGSDNGLSPGRRQAIIWTNAGILLIGPLGTNFSQIVIEIQTFSLRKMRLKISSVKRQPFCIGLNVLIHVSKMVPDHRDDSMITHTKSAYRHQSSRMIAPVSVKQPRVIYVHPTCTKNTRDHNISGDVIIQGLISWINAFR